MCTFGRVYSDLPLVARRRSATVGAATALPTLDYAAPGWYPPCMPIGARTLATPDRTASAHSLRAMVAVLAAALLTLAAPTMAQASQRTKVVRATSGRGCIVNSLPAFMDQGEGPTVGSVADIIEVECEVTGAEQYDGKISITDTELYNRCGKEMSWTAPPNLPTVTGPSFTESLDEDGNATAVLWAGPNCRPGETTIVADEQEYPFETYMSTYTVLPPEPTPEGVYALDPCETGACASKVEDDNTGSVVTIVEVELPIVEAHVAIEAQQLYSRCGHSPHLLWIGPDEVLLSEKSVLTELETDNDGNAFVVLMGGASCQPGTVRIFADLEEESFETYSTAFTALAPQPTI